MAWRGIAELNTLSRRVALSLLYSFTPRPNTAVYVGYDDLSPWYFRLTRVRQ